MSIYSYVNCTVLLFGAGVKGKIESDFSTQKSRCIHRYFFCFLQRLLSFFILFLAMASTAPGTVSTTLGGAAAAGRTANALYPTFSRFNNIGSCRSNENQ